MNLMTSFTPNCLQEVLRDSLLTIRIILFPHLLVALNSLEDLFHILALEALGLVALA